jgi:hypothetical protein
MLCRVLLHACRIVDCAEGLIDAFDTIAQPVDGFLHNSLMPRCHGSRCR